MENFKNIASTILVSAGTVISFIEQYTIYARAVMESYKGNNK